jgi:hypothetical protein
MLDNIIDILYNKATEEISCRQTFIVKILIIETSAAMRFYSTMERRDNRHVVVETERERAWVCVHCEKMGLASIKEWTLDITCV